MLLFRSEETVDRWCEARGVPRRPILNLDQVWFLAVTWYEDCMTPESRRPAAQEMVGIFGQVGLHGDFWDPHADVGRTGGPEGIAPV
jgi:hypothetical protein